MRLIDLDEVIDAIESTEWYHLVNGKLSEGAEGDESALYKAEDVYKAIKGVPVVDAIPVKHGKWKKIKGAINCSACKNCSWSTSFKGLVSSFNYCPNCGADMKGENNE